MESIIGQGVTRIDAVDKASGTAMYANDLCPANALIAKVLHSDVANGLVKSIDISEAEKLPGVVKIITCFDVPDILFATPGHPWSLDPAGRDIHDRKLLNARVRYIGDDVAAVVAEDEISAERALEKIKVEYEEYPAYPDWRSAIAPGAQPIHPELCDSNIVRQHPYEAGDLEAVISQPGLVSIDRWYFSQALSHCHIEPTVCYAYEECGRITIVSATQIPHVLRRITAQALGLPWGKVRIIKPYVGGGFGNKQDVLYEPLVAFLSQRVGGRCVAMTNSREEIFASTRRRHPIHFHMRAWARPDGRLVAHEMDAWSDQGAYASHGHAIAANATTYARDVYMSEQAVRTHAYTVYSNSTTSGAMRGYGIPQAVFAMECMAEDMAAALNMDPVEFRRKNMIYEGFSDPLTGITCHSNGLPECLDKGMEYMHWAEKRQAYAGQKGPVRRGVGMALFIYKTGVHPICLETASCRMLLNQDGSLQMQLGATEIGQGADTVFCQMAAETVGLPFADVHILSAQDTDISPYDSGAYASRQSFVSGMAVKKTGLELKERILEEGAKLLERPAAELDVAEGFLIGKGDGQRLLSLGELVTEARYSRSDSRHLGAECTCHCQDNSFATGCCFAEVEVDIPLGRVKVLDIVSVHDCGTVINPLLAQGQVHGGVSMGLGMALSENMLYDSQGRLLNDNLLYYKVPTAADTPDLHSIFVEPKDPAGPYGNKALGEATVLPVSPAIRNAVLNATGVAVDDLPLDVERLLGEFRKHGLLDEYK